jgi:hypothetical protein
MTTLKKDTHLKRTNVRLLIKRDIVTSCKIRVHNLLNALLDDFLDLSTTKIYNLSGILLPYLVIHAQQVLEHIFVTLEPGMLEGFLGRWSVLGVNFQHPSHQIFALMCCVGEITFYHT